MNKPFWLVILLLVIELAVILILVPGNWTEKVMHREADLVETVMGERTQRWISDQAESLYYTSFVQTGLEEGMHRALIPTEEEKKRSKGMEGMGGRWFEWVEGRLYALEVTVMQFYSRLALLRMWAPYMLILLLPALYDGVMTWKIKRTNFDYASPVIHRYGLRITRFLVLALMITFFAPIAINPIIIPTVMMLCCVLIGLAIGNVQKRI